MGVTESGARRGAVGGRIPVVVLAGFLGSGKTTLLNHLLRTARGTRIGAIVNDFGSIEIDAMAVSGQVDAMVSLGDGCLCCAVDTSDMDEVLDVLARPAAGMDVIVIEASGVAEPETLIRMVLASSSPHIVYGGLVEVVDAAEFESVRVRHPELERHAGAADLLVLNKADRVTDDHREALHTQLRRLSPGTPVVPASFGRVDPALLFDRVRRARPPVEQLSFDSLLYGTDDDDGYSGAGPSDAGHGPPAAGRPCEGGDSHHDHLHDLYESVEFAADRALDPRRFLEFLDTRPAGLYRIKGYVDFGAADPEHRYEVHAVGGFLRFAPEPRPRSGHRGTELVLIGSGVDGAALLRGLHACTAGPEAPDEQALWGVLRFVDRAPEDDGGYGGDEPPYPEPYSYPEPDSYGPYGEDGSGPYDEPGAVQEFAG
ncbi:CobW family GTP-binding protein [Streptomyces qinglanensis]|uniref:GTPase, G3E family n=1 Tax=Streptomyces qinglanensis TaxID=943816 RepID=A0A1H9WPK7_9ACTN|nr:GTP-binding protein [Streptomyces qinglanensis]SES35719.1 GTPase, G3E family [Streptomyces qinglanensis]